MNKKYSARRLQDLFPQIYSLLSILYGEYPNFPQIIGDVCVAALEAYQIRPEDLKQLDLERESQSNWYQSQEMMGGVCYVDKFSGTLKGLGKKLSYLEELGLTYLHLMPLFAAPEANSDGGYAISDYRRVNSRLGTMEDLSNLTAKFRTQGISLALDFVFNHTSDEHEWAKKARAGESTYQDYYLVFDDRAIPDRYEQHLREIFPEQAPGSFTYLEDMDKWVWTTFWEFQWDLNYRNPDVFIAMLKEMLFLANVGVEVLRLDAVAFIWKEMGTSCEGLPNSHVIIQAYNQIVRMVAPAMIFKSEAIVHPAEVATYIDPNECQISYNPTLMALLWESLATRNVSLLQRSMARWFPIPQECSWVNYVRVHDDIGWTFADEDARDIHIDGYAHRQFLNSFYVGKTAGSFAVGVPFGYNESTGDMRISGTCASLAGLELAMENNDGGWIGDAINRIVLLHSVILSIGGIPLLYLGDEVGILNDYSYEDDPELAEDSRWIHRSQFDWERAETRFDTETIVGQLFQQIKLLIQLRKQTPILADGHTLVIDTQNPHVLGYVRNYEMVVVANFSESHQKFLTDVLRAYVPSLSRVSDLVTNDTVTLGAEVTLAPYQFLWLVPEKT